VYYETLIEAPMTLLSLYKSESTCSTGDKSKVISHNGLEEISESLKSIQPNCLLDIRNVVVQGSFENSLIITVTGLVRDALGDSERPFTQVFVLHPQKPKGLFVLNEIFLYTDESDVPDPLRKPVEQVDAKQEEVVTKEEPIKEVKNEDNQPKEDPKPVEEPKKPRKQKENPKKKQTAQKPREDKKETEKKVETAVAKELKKPTETVDEKPKVHSWASIAKKGKPEGNTPAVPPKVESPATNASVEPPKASPATKKPESASTESREPKPTSGNTSNAESRYLEVRNFDGTAKAETLKKAFSQFGAVSYVRFLGNTRAVIEFEDAKSAQKALVKKSIKVGEKNVQMFVGSPHKPNPRRKDGNPRRGSPQTRGSNRGGRDSSRQ